MYLDNNWYGNRSILAKYCNIKDQRAFAAIQHGINTFPGKRKFPGQRKLENYIPYLCWNSHAKNELLKNNIKNITAIGAPILYLDKIFSKKKFLFKEKGTLVFPSKSTQEYNRNENYGELVDKVEREFNGPYTISVYYTDLNKDLSIFKEKGWRIISFGNRKSKKFLIKQYIEICKSKNVVCTTLSGSFLHAVFLKKNFKLFINNDQKYEDKKDYHNIENEEYYKKNYPEIYFNKASKEDLYKYSLSELGFDDLKSKDELIKLMGWDSPKKNFFATIMSYLLFIKYYIFDNINA